MESLSDKIWLQEEWVGESAHIKVEDVKQFIKELKKELFVDREYGIQDCKYSCGEILKMINELAGDKLTECAN